MSGPRYWAVVPAAGVGRRAGGAVPKQYLELGGRKVIEHTLERLCAHPRIARVVVVLAADDRWWAGVRIDAGRAPLRATGGPERCDSVLNGLQELARLARPSDWVLVHDAARPCLRAADLERLIARASEHPVGGLLALPVRDTVKRAGAAGTVRETVDRDGLWRALTPQMFRLKPLIEALRAARERGIAVTDEAEAMELAGAAPCLVEGSADNIKITRPEDLAMAELYLELQASGG